jgi:hypothetical protein
MNEAGLAFLGFAFWIVLTGGALLGWHITRDYRE